MRIKYGLVLLAFALISCKVDTAEQQAKKTTPMGSRNIIKTKTTPYEQEVLETSSSTTEITTCSWPSSIGCVPQPEETKTKLADSGQSHLIVNFHKRGAENKAITNDHIYSNNGLYSELISGKLSVKGFSPGQFPNEKIYIDYDYHTESFKFSGNIKLTSPLDNVHIEFNEDVCQSIETSKHDKGEIVTFTDCEHGNPLISPISGKIFISNDNILPGEEV